MGKSYLGEFEQLVLQIVAILMDDAYGNTIVKSISEKAGRKVNLSSVHTTLYRLEEKGFVKSQMGGATTSRGGRRKRLFKITNPGIAVLKKVHVQQKQIWELIPQIDFSGL